MSIFAIILKERNEEVTNLIEESYPDNYPLSDSVFLVSRDTLADKIAKEIKIKGDDRIEDALGVVFKLSGAYAGYASRALWEWLDKVEEEGDA